MIIQLLIFTNDTAIDKIRVLVKVNICDKDEQGTQKVWAVGQ